ncbi:MAG TPA: tetratricopeptide repeat protein [Nitrospirota bacterium]|nr:tetratricopeptide repeat protein [Nitrospirota bacterium]
MASLKKALDKALAHYEKKEYADAERGADIMVEAFPDFAHGQFLKAVILEETGRAEQAQDYYNKAGKLSMMWMRLAMRLQDIDPARAIIYFEKARAQDSGNNHLVYSLGLAYEKAGRANEARKCFQSLNMQREVITRLLSPLGFLVIMIAGAIAMFKRHDFVLASLVTVSAVICLFWIKRDGGLVFNMMKRKAASQ